MSSMLRVARLGSCRRWLAGLLLCASVSGAFAADIYGYVDDKGVAHFSAEKLDPRDQLFFKGGQNFDTKDGVTPLLQPGVDGGDVSGPVSPASQTLLALFEASPTYKVAKLALRDASPTYKVAKLALRDASRIHAIDYELLQALVATESGFHAQAVSPKGAMGLMQLMPGTAGQYGVRADLKRSLEAKLFDPRINIAAGARYLSHLLTMFSGELDLALAAYNAGEGAVQRAGNKIPNYRETQNYVKTVLQLYAFLKPSTAPRGYGNGATGRGPERVRMELAVPPGGALRRGNMPSSPALTLPPIAPIDPVAPD